MEGRESVCYFGCLNKSNFKKGRECVLFWMCAVKEGPHDIKFWYKRKGFVIPKSYSLNPLA